MIFVKKLQGTDCIASCSEQEHSHFSFDLAAFLNQQLQNPWSAQEILQCRRMLDDTLMRLQQEGNRK